MPTHRPVRTGLRNVLTFTATAVAVIAAVELVDHDTQRPAYAATLAVPTAAKPAAVPQAAAAPQSPAVPASSGPELADLELVGRSIANYDR